MRAAATDEQHRERSAPARVLRTFAGVVLGDAGEDVASDAAVQRVIVAARDVDVPSHVQSIAQSNGVRSIEVKPDDTLLDTKGGAAALSREPTGIGTRYRVGEMIGRGGMGEVRLARDTRIEREVAVKLMRAKEPDEEKLSRFFREARVQGALEHPSVVPVHDLGIDPESGPYFVMKRLSGITLSDVMKSEDETVRSRWPRRQLLAKLVDICRAVDFAHVRGVIHRDLKPANIMLGEYGESYVLDWGLARISSDPDSLDGKLAISGESGEGDTAVGATLGTPGYMSPEQARGDSITTATDVFSLGIVLFEILARRNAMPHGPLGVVMTMDTEKHRPSKYARDVPPELDDLCARATLADASVRPSARQFADALQAYLDGDRDLARRRELAEEHAALAVGALASGDDDDARATAMREAGRAIALDPTNADAAQVVGRLMLASPTKIPEQALASADQEVAEARQNIMRQASHGYLITIAISLVLFFLPLRSYAPAIAATVTCTVAFFLSRHMARSPIVDRSRLILVFFCITVTMYVIAGYIFGPLVVMPIIMIGGIASFLSQPSRYYAPYITVLGFVVPFVAMLLLELVGWLPRTVHFEGGSIVLTSQMLELGPISTTIILSVALLTQVINTLLVAKARNCAQLAAAETIHTQTWHLKQLLPGLDAKRDR